MALDKDQVVKRVFNATKLSLNANDSGAPTAPQPTVHLSAKQIWKRIFNSATDKIRLVKA